MDFKLNTSELFPSPNAVPEDTREPVAPACGVVLGNTVARTSRGFLGDLTFFLDLSEDVDLPTLVDDLEFFDFFTSLLVLFFSN